MNEPICFKSQERFKFEPVCVNCGKETKHTFQIDAATPLSINAVSLFIPYSKILNYFVFNKKGLVRIPFCSKCHRDFFLPGRSSIINIFIVIILIALFFYLMAYGYYIYAAISIGVAFVSLFFMLRKDIRRSRVTLPFKVWMDSGEFCYQFHSGYYFEKLKSTMEEK